MGSTIVSSGDRVSNNDLQHIFVHGAYNLGAILNEIEAEEACHPGENLQFADGAGGEDGVVLAVVNSALSIGVAEIDFLQISSCATDYDVGNDIPVIFYHWNPGALLRNIPCVDQQGDVAKAGVVLAADDGTAGQFTAVTEPTLATEADNLGFTAAATIGDNGANGTTIVYRGLLRQAIYQADASAAYDVVAWILNS